MTHIDETCRNLSSSRLIGHCGASFLVCHPQGKKTRTSLICFLRSVWRWRHCALGWGFTLTYTHVSDWRMPKYGWNSFCLGVNYCLPDSTSSTARLLFFYQLLRVCMCVGVCVCVHGRVSRWVAYMSRMTLLLINCSVVLLGVTVHAC